MTRKKAERFLTKHHAILNFSKDGVQVSAGGHSAEGADLRSAVKALRPKLQVTDAPSEDAGKKRNGKKEHVSAN